MTQFDTTLRNKGYNVRLEMRREINDYVKYVTQQNVPQHYYLLGTLASKTSLSTLLAVKN